MLQDTTLLIIAALLSENTRAFLPRYDGRHATYRDTRELILESREYAQTRASELSRGLLGKAAFNVCSRTPFQRASFYWPFLFHGAPPLGRRFQDRRVDARRPGAFRSINSRLFSSSRRGFSGRILKK